MLQAKRTAKHTAKRGAGLFVWIVIAVLVVISILALGHTTLTSSLSTDANALVRGDIALTLAESAIHEAMAQLRVAANDPESQIYQELRTLLYVPDTGALILSSHCELKETRALTEMPDYQGYDIDAPLVEVVCQRHLDGTAYERCGVIRYQVVVRAPGGFGRRPVRRVEVTQPFKTCLTCTPRPFCLGGVCIANARDYTDSKALAEVHRRFVIANERLWEAYERARAMAPAELRERVEQFERRLIPREDVKLETPTVSSAGQALLIGCFEGEATFALSSLDLARYLQRRAMELQELERQAAGADCTVFLDLAEKATTIIEQSFYHLWARQDAFRYFTEGDEFYQKYQEHFYKFEDAYWRRRSQYVVKPRPEEKDCNDAWQRFLREHPRPAGVISVENEDEMLQLRGRVRGKFVLVVGRGGVTIENFNSSDEPDDVVTVVVCSGPVKLRGEVRCSLFFGARPEEEMATLDMNESTRLVGNLTAWQLPQGRLEGTLVRLEKYSSGITLDDGRVVLARDYLHVAISPKIIYRKVGRS